MRGLCAWPMCMQVEEADVGAGTIKRSMSTDASHTASHGAAQAVAQAVRPAAGYAGDISPQTAFDWWQSGAGVLVDIRTSAEMEWVGYVPGAPHVAWKQWPGMVLNPQFDDALRAAVPAGKKALLLCRSGVRSIAAAKRATELGYEAYNILEGFEGDPDAQGHRNRAAGWRARGLPWRQN